MLPTEEARLSAIDVAAAQQNVAAAKEVLANVENMRPEVSRLNELGREVSLGDDEVRRLAVLNERWEEACRDKGKELKQLEQRLVQVEQFTERFDEWTQFVSRVEINLQPQPTSSYESLLDHRKKIEVALSLFIKHCTCSFVNTLIFGPHHSTS